tara:strand:+ start:852 stop:1700 length:849 start_codon:yes stop_codon:yes gene_type:complete
MTKKKIVFIADAFVEDIAGGGELNNAEATLCFLQQGYDVHRIYSRYFTPQVLNDFKGCFFILGNFVLVPPPSLKGLLKEDFLIYEHDHKYIRSRNPAIYENYLAPKDQLINLPLYKSAKAVLCQSQFHKDIVYKNTGLSNLVSLGGNLWPLTALEYMREISKQDKNDCVSVLDSNIEHKGTNEAIMFCRAKNYDFKLVRDANYRNFLAKLGANNSFAFFPKTPETLSRVVVEARMMGLKIISNNNIGATKEEWFQLRGEALIDFMIEKRAEISNKILSYVGE